MQALIILKYIQRFIWHGLLVVRVGTSSAILNGKSKERIIAGQVMDYLERFKTSDKVAIVTGGSKGLGREMALALGEGGAKVVVTSRSKALIEETANDITQKGGKAIAVSTDVKSPESIDAMVQKVLSIYGRVDILINNAGIAPMKYALDTTVEDWEDVIDTNLKSAFLLSKAVGAGMVERHSGKIINIGSILGTMAANVTMPYCVTKAGIAQMTRALALEWAPFGINVNCIAPGFFETEMTRQQQEDETHKKFLRFKIPLKRLGKPEEIVGAAMFLASEASGYMTGAVLTIDGGYTIW
ncbi:MAG: 2-dehydro-3-deoxy-D-gluconate 5-dehydrogenase [Syntrophus sp. SKADARSKE-3]|nr:2-dehydro-3-deoxy-D-gluconate 5-dehydrogenase [Syntrophus sp. SKADARSKE-3]